MKTRLLSGKNMKIISRKEAPYKIENPSGRTTREKAV